MLALPRGKNKDCDSTGRVSVSLPIGECVSPVYAKRYRQNQIKMISIAPFFVADSMAELEGWTVPGDLMLGCPMGYAEFAKIVVFLASEQAKFITGTTIKVDEAYSASI